MCEKMTASNDEEERKGMMKSDCLGRRGYERKRERERDT